MFCRTLFVLVFPFSFEYCIFCLLIYSLWLSHWIHQTFPKFSTTRKKLLVLCNYFYCWQLIIRWPVVWGVSCMYLLYSRISHSQCMLTHSQCLHCSILLVNNGLNSTKLCKHCSSPLHQISLMFFLVFSRLHMLIENIMIGNKHVEIDIKAND